MTTADTVPLDPQQVRQDFPILHRLVHEKFPLVYLDNAATTQRPRQVIQSIVQTSEQHYANVHRGIHTLSEQSTELYESARRKVQQFLNAAWPEEIIFTRGTTESINLVARSWGDANTGPGDEILLTEMEHHANLVPWHQLAARTGVQLRFIPLRDDGQLDLEQLERLLSPRTRLVAVSAMSNVLGTVPPLERIVQAARSAGALVLVDAAQWVPHRPTDVQAWDADFVAFSGHKMLGPSGVGVLYGRRELLERMPPFLGGGGMIRRVTLQGFEPAEIPARFEAGTPPIVAAIGLGVAIDYLRQFSWEDIQAHELRLTRLAHELLEQIPGLRILGPAPENKGGIVSFVFRRIHAHDVAYLLDRHGVAVRAGHHCAMPLHKRYGVGASTRASFYLYNTEEEVHRLAEALDQVRQFFRQ